MCALAKMNLEGSNVMSRMTLSAFYKFAEQHDGRWEFVGGVPIALASPSSLHQDIAMGLTLAFGNFFKGKRCTPRATSDVKLFDDRDDIRIPDLMVFCDKSKDDGQKYNGAPELVVEIWSSSNRPAERHRKLADYMEAGVQEIWEVFPTEKHVRRHFLNLEGDYDETIYVFGASMESEVFRGLTFDLIDFV